MFKRVKEFLKSHKLTNDVYIWVKTLRDNIIRKSQFNCRKVFIDRSRNQDKLCIVLAGYKDYLYDYVFDRLKKYAIDDMDICVVSSGLYSEKLNSICKVNGWSYLSTCENNVSLVQNVAISLFENAKYIFKLDEDIFITENYFSKMLEAYEHATKGKYNVGIFAPLININGYSSCRILEKLNLVDKYEEKFGDFRYGSGPQTVIDNDPEFAKFMWGKDSIIPDIDSLNDMFSKEPLSETTCPFRFSIGAILYERDLWEQMNYFPVRKNDAGMGDDERKIDCYCFLEAKPVVISENIVVGHLSFSNQNSVMKDYIKEIFNQD